MLTNLLKELRRKSLQIGALLCVSFSVIGAGEAMSWSSPALHYLTGEDSDIPIEGKLRSWIAAINSLGTILGFLMIPLFLDRLGRKYSMIIYAVLQSLSWTIIIFGRSFAVLCLARVISGFGYSGAVSLTIVYLSEITDKEIRGMVTVCLVLSSDIGILIVNFLGAYSSYHIMNLVLIIPSVVYLLCLPFLPESPYFCLMKNQEERGIKILMKLRGEENPQNVKVEAGEIKASAEKHQKNKLNFLVLFTSRANRRALIIVLIAQMTFVLSGSLVILSYTQEIFKYSDYSLSSANSALLLAGVKIFSGLIASQLIEKASRRVFFLISGLLCAASLSSVAVFFLLKKQAFVDVSSVSWIPLAGLLTYQIALPLGVSTIPHIFAGELFSLEVKKCGVIVGYLITPLMMFVLKLTFPMLNDLFGIHLSFFIFAACCIFGAFLLFFIAPETRGKSLEEIQAILNQN